MSVCMSAAIKVYLFTHGGGIVTGTDDIELARDVMREKIRHEWADRGPFPWYDYDFSGDEPHFERGRWVPSKSDLVPRWVDVNPGASTRGAIRAVVWRN